MGTYCPEYSLLFTTEVSNEYGQDMVVLTWLCMICFNTAKMLFENQPQNIKKHAAARSVGVAPS